MAEGKQRNSNTPDADGSINIRELRGKGITTGETRVPGWPGWMMAGLFALRKGEFVLVEMRVFPDEDRNPEGWLEEFGKAKTPAQRQKVARRNPRLVAGRPHPSAGEWSRDPGRLDELSIGDGLPAAMLKALRTTPLFDQMKDFGDLLSSAPEAPEVYQQMAESPNPGRHARGDLHWAEWARRIDKATRTGSTSPINDVAEELGIDRKRVRDIAHPCRKKGFLTEEIPPHGGGYMTEKARQVLNDAKKGRKR